jgi:endonuclease YncB( thermonuclease family)
MWALLLALTLADAAKPPPGGWPAPPTEARVTSVYDGDTFTLATGDKIRLKWVNTPEMKPEEPYAREAKEFTERFILDESVKLLLDGPNPRDSYGRVLAGIIGPRGNLTEELLRNGYGHLFIIPPDPLDATPLIAAQEEARANRRGIWSTEGFQGAMHITSFHANASGDDTQNVNGEYMRICNVSSAPVDVAGWRLVDRSGASHVFPSVVIPPGHTVKVMSGKGLTQPDPIRQLEIYLGSDIPLWNNELEEVHLYDPQGNRVDRREHHGSGSR